MRRGDVAIRIGGDEFVVLLPEADAEEAETIAERVLERVANEAELPSISVGIATWRPHRSLEEMLAEADRRMYESKVRRKKQATRDTRRLRSAPG